MKQKTLKLSEENVGNILHDVGKGLSPRLPIVQKLRSTIGKWEFMNLKICTVKKELTG